MKLETIIKKSDIKFKFIDYNGNWIYENKDNLYYFEKAEDIKQDIPFFDWTADRKIKLIKNQALCLVDNNKCWR